VVLLQAADSSMGDDRLQVVGVAHTGTSALDRQAAWMRQSDLAWLAALEGQAHALMVRTERGADLEQTAVALRAALFGVSGPELVVRTWQELAPDLRQFVQLMDVTVGLMYGLLFFVAALGILNAQRMSALERRRELAVMMAMGATPARTAGLLIIETILLTALGAAAGALFGWAVVAWHELLLKLISRTTPSSIRAFAWPLQCAVQPSLACSTRTPNGLKVGEFPEL
jgi:ABC-type lipoprotein release transport system permease subunit